MKLLIQYGWLVDPATGLNTMGNLLIEDGKIAAISGRPMTADKVIDAAGLTVAPVWWICTSTCESRGSSTKETIETGCAAAAHGGVTTLVAMANTNPVTDTPERIVAIPGTRRELPG